MEEKIGTLKHSFEGTQEHLERMKAKALGLGLKTVSLEYEEGWFGIINGKIKLYGKESALRAYVSWLADLE